MRLGDKAEGAKVSQADPGQDDVAELAAGRLDNRCVPKSLRHIGSETFVISLHLSSKLS